jgi:hypothetical protein
MSPERMRKCRFCCSSCCSCFHRTLESTKKGIQVTFCETVGMLIKSIKLLTLVVTTCLILRLNYIHNVIFFYFSFSASFFIFWHYWCLPFFRIGLLRLSDGAANFDKIWSACGQHQIYYKRETLYKKKIQFKTYAYLKKEYFLRNRQLVSSKFILSCFLGFNREFFPLPSFQICPRRTLLWSYASSGHDLHNTLLTKDNL